MKRPADVRAWRRIRFAVIEADGFRCRKCGKPGRLEVDHIVPLHRGGSAFDVSNLQALCRGCHIEKTKAERGAQNPVDGRNTWLIRLRQHGGIGQPATGHTGLSAVAPPGKQHMGEHRPSADS